MNKNDQQFIASRIRAQYVEKEASELDALRALDTKVKRPVNIFSYVLGSIGAIVMGAGMSLIMTDISSMIGMESTLLPGLVFGICGMLLALLNYPLHKHLMGRRKAKYSKEILALSEQIMTASKQ